MRHVLVVGATGQLGADAVRQLCEAGRFRVRALVRPGSRAAHLDRPDVERVTGDLKDPDSLRRACAGIDVVVATATVVFPRRGDTFAADEEQGYRNLINACSGAGVKRFVYTSLATPLTRAHCDLCATYRAKALVEGLLERSSLGYSILRCGPFMDDYFALIGSRIPLRGEPSATLARSRGLARAFRSLCGSTIDRWGLAVVPGPPSRRHAFVAVADVAARIVKAVERDCTREIVPLGGPEALSWSDVAALYGRLLGRPVRTLAIPCVLIRWLGRLGRLGRLGSEAFANQMAILQILAENDTGHLAERVDAGPTTAHGYLASKLELCP